MTRRKKLLLEPDLSSAFKKERMAIIRQVVAEKEREAERIAAGDAPELENEVPVLEAFEPDTDTAGLSVKAEDGATGEESPEIGVPESGNDPAPVSFIGVPVPKKPKTVSADVDPEDDDRDLPPVEGIATLSDKACEACHQLVGRGERCFLFVYFRPGSVLSSAMKTVTPLLLVKEPEAQNRVQKDTNLVIVHANQNCVQRYKNLVLKPEKTPESEAESHFPKTLTLISPNGAHPPAISAG